MVCTERAYAKLNLTLDILGKRPDGYHDLRMVMQSVDLFDEVSVETRETGGVTVRADLDYLPRNGDNLAVKAALAFFREAGVQPPGLHIQLKKRIPVCAGMAGGSSDGAAVLRALGRLYPMPREALERIGAAVGSDVPYCVRGGTALAEGRGEVLTDLPALPMCHIVLCKPDFPISTPELFRAVKPTRCHPDTAGMLAALKAGDLDGVAHRLYNVFEDFLPRRCQEVREIKSALLDLGALGAARSGSGPPVFGLFREAGPAQEAAACLARRYRRTYTARPVGPA